VKIHTFTWACKTAGSKTDEL